MASKKPAGKKSKAASERYIIWFTPNYMKGNKGWQSLDENTTGVFRTRAAALSAIAKNVERYYSTPGSERDAQSRQFSVRVLGVEK